MLPGQRSAEAEPHSGPIASGRVPRDPAADSSARTRPFTPVLRLFGSAVVSAGSSVKDGAVAACAEVWFDYSGTRIRLGDEVTRVLVHSGRGLEAVPRDSAAEHEACRAIERLGAVDASCLDDIVTDEPCDYVVHPFSGASERTAFTTAAQRTLHAQGWILEIDPAYPYQLAQTEQVTWDVAVHPDEELPDWFSLELGVVVDGKRVDLLPLVLEFVDSAGEEEDLKSIARRIDGTVSLRISDTHNVPVPVERFQGLVRVVVELYQGVRSKAPRAASALKPDASERVALRFPAKRAPSIAKLAGAIASCPGQMSLDDKKGVVARGRAVLDVPTDIAPSVPGLKATLRPYQRQGVAFLQHLRDTGSGGVLADDMGLGKTLQTIAHLCQEKAAGRLVSPGMIVAPTSLAFNWGREIDKFAPHLSTLLLVGPQRRAMFEKIGHYDLVITTYPVLVRDIDRLEKLHFSSVVLDEAQAIKNVRSQTHKALSRLQAEHRICLSGTPVENDLGELWSIFHFLEPTLFGDEGSFRERFRIPIETRGDETRMEALRDIVAPYVLRRTKREVAPELPEKTELFRPVELSGPQRELYEQIRVAAHADVRRAIRKKGLSGSAISILDAIMKLRQVCCDPRLVSLDEARRVSESAKYNALMTLLETELPAGRRILIFSQFTSMLSLISRGLEERRIEYTILTGETRDRRAAVDSFESGRVPVFLISLKAGGTGLNLISADTVVHYDPWWNPASQAQATDRAYRIGQTKPVFVHHLYVAGSVEERVLMLQRRKAWLAASLLGDATAAAPSGLSELDVERLLSPLD
ncbi:MAG: DEAD/DEAH box helicase [Polyangiaceae bacterium]|nr:DEAD/DEAH box helicase [Polyangiaceae bacterium]